ncbi:LysR substrate-binding domain-containing protein [Sphingomonas flavescens]|uniref:LysR substrate-binding domain-containing protein n=1 Tax=Sphingomonas flavescens TaxID=3132797 RepID=UPI00280612B9|nr:LysR substrate-binding domain-containing protein [Sphingomonas limnosediminicola]
MLHCTTSEVDSVRRLPPLGSIQAFVQVARLGSLKAAADALALSSPALTRRIQSLEQFVGAALFSRHHNVVELNERGLAFLEEIGPHLDAIATAVERVSEDQRSTRIRIAVPSLFAAQRLVPALPSLRQLHPQLIVDVDTGANRLPRLDSDVDAAIVITDAIPDRYYARALEQGRIVAIGSRELLEEREPVRSPTDLRRLPILLHREMPGAFDEWCRAAGFPGVRPASITHYDAGQLILDAAAAGLGVAFMLESHLNSSSDDRLVRIFNQTAASPYAYWFACPPNALQRRGVRQFHDWVVSHFAAPEEAAVVNG